MYINCHTYYSFKYGTLSPEELFESARKNGVYKLILTQINNTCGWIEFAKLCKNKSEEYNLQFSIGVEFRLENKFLYLAVAKNMQGFEEINRFLSEYNLSHQPYPQIAPAFTNVFVIYEWKKDFNLELRENEFIGVRLSQINKLINFKNKAYLERLTLLQPVTFRNKAGYNTHKLLRAIDLNTLVSKLSKEDICQDDEYMIPSEDIKAKCSMYPQLVKNTEYILDSCDFVFDLVSDKNKKTYSESLEDDIKKLRSLTYEGLAKRYNASSKRQEAIDRAEKELAVIRQLNFEAYFLINYDIISYAKKCGFAYVGRGSGANSLVSYCLTITDVDPIELDLYFERFLNMYRSSPPDFDIDFSWKDRDEIIKYVFNKYGAEHTALLATYTTFQGKSIVRELGKVFGLPKREIEGILQNTEKVKNRDHITKAIFKYAELIKDFPKNLSIHAGGILITEKPIYSYTATSHPPKDFPTTHFNMWEAEDIRIFKFDILSQRGLGHIKDTVQIIKENRGSDIDIHNIELLMNDPQIANLLQTGKTMGCFYVESPAMRMLLGKLQCKTYPVLVAASSIIRPGVASSGMMREYIYRHHHPDKFSYIHPKMEELMKETYGVMVYQEDVIKVVHHFGKLNLAEADIIRRGMSGKFRSKGVFKILEQKYFDNCEREGHPKEVAEEVWRQVESFSGYSFSKAHSASFAVESYQSLFLKAYYPLEFMVGVINNFGGFYRTEFYFHEARLAGATIEAPCINHSEYLTTILGKTIYMGFIHLKNLEKKSYDLLLRSRDEGTIFRSLEDFLLRVPLKLEQMILLIRIGAFRFTGKTKKNLLWDLQALLSKVDSRSSDSYLFPLHKKEFKLPQLEEQPFDDAHDEIELLEFPLCDPFKLLGTQELGDSDADSLIEMENKKITITGYLVTVKDTWTKAGIYMNFGTFLDHKGHFFDTVHFPNVARKYHLVGKGFYKMKGKVVLDFGYPMIELDFIERLPMVDRYGKLATPQHYN